MSLLNGWIGLVLMVVAGVAGAEPAVVRPTQLRGFVAESPTAVLLREARDVFHRVVLAAPCPALATADTFDFQIGDGVFEKLDAANARIPLIRSPVPSRVSSATRDLHVVVGPTGGLRAACRVARIEAADQAAFDAASAPRSPREDRRDATGR